MTLDNIPDSVKSLPSISGTSADTAPEQVDSVQVQIKNATDNTYWNGSSWVSTDIWLEATGTTSWDYSMPPLSNGKSYELKVISIDKAGNESQIASDSFTVHSHSPLPIWVWVVIGITGVLTIGIVLNILRRRLANP